MQKHFSLFLFFRQSVKLIFGEVNDIFFRKHFKVYGYAEVCGGSVTTKISQCHQSQILPKEGGLDVLTLVVGSFSVRVDVCME